MFRKTVLFRFFSEEPFLLLSDSRTAHFLAKWLCVEYAYCYVKIRFFFNKTRDKNRIASLSFAARYLFFFQDISVWRIGIVKSFRRTFWRPFTICAGPFTPPPPRPNSTDSNGNDEIVLFSNVRQWYHAHSRNPSARAFGGYVGTSCIFKRSCCTRNSFRPKRYTRVGERRRVGRVASNGTGTGNGRRRRGGEMANKINTSK